jgi:hypothetical protein
MCLAQVGFVISISGGKLSEEVLELLPDYSLAFMGEDGPAGFAGAAAEDSSGVELDRSCAYYTCDGTQQLNNEFGDLQHKIQDLEVRGWSRMVRGCYSMSLWLPWGLIGFAEPITLPVSPQL